MSRACKLPDPLAGTEDRAEGWARPVYNNWHHYGRGAAMSDCGRAIYLGAVTKPSPGADPCKTCWRIASASANEATAGRGPGWARTRYQVNWHHYADSTALSSCGVVLYLGVTEPVPEPDGPACKACRNATRGQA